MLPGKTRSSTGTCSRCCGDLSSQRRPPRRNCIALSCVARYCVMRRLVVGAVVVAPARHVGECLEQHRRDVVGQQLDLFVDVIGGHLVHEREMRHHDVDHPDGDVHPGPPRVRSRHPPRAGNGNGSIAFPVRHGAEGGRRRQQVVQVGGAGAGQTRDHHRRPQFDVVDLGMTAEQVGQQEPVLEQLQQLPIEVDHPGVVQAVDLAQRGEVDVEPFAVVVGTEIVQAGVGAGLGVQRVGIQRALRGPSRPSCRGSAGPRR